MGGVEAFDDLKSERQSFFDRDRTTAQPIEQRLSLDQLQDEKMDVVGRLKVVDPSNVRVVERREHLRLSLEPCESLRIRREVLRQHPERHLALAPAVLGPLHRPPAALHVVGGALERRVGAVV